MKDNRPPKEERTLKRGDVREDGQMFWGYRKTAKCGEWWMSASKFNEMKSNALKSRRESFMRNATTERERSRAYNHENKEKLLERKRDYVARNPCKVRKWQQADYKRRMADPLKKLIHNQRTRIAQALRGASKWGDTLSLVGCTAKELKHHLEAQFTPGMTWENYGSWHVDHIKPCASFNLSLDSDQAKCFHYSNLQPLWAEDNLRKSDKYE